MHIYKFYYWDGNNQRNIDFYLRHALIFTYEELTKIIEDIKNNGQRKTVFDVIECLKNSYDFKELDLFKYNLGSDYNF